MCKERNYRENEVVILFRRFKARIRINLCDECMKKSEEELEEYAEMVIQQEDLRDENE
jgi:hypothetical protein